MDGARCIAVMYHYVGDRAGIAEAGIRGLDIAAFEAQLDELSSHAEPTDWLTFHAWRQGAGDLPGRCFLLTFDDGLRDHAEVVQPILDRRGLRGVFFVPGRILADRRMLPAHQIHLLLAGMGSGGLTENVKRWLGDQASEAEWWDRLDRECARRIYHYESSEVADLKYLLGWTMPLAVRDRLLGDLFAAHVGDVCACADRWYLSWSQLIALRNAGHTIGGHGFSHEPYERLSPAEQRRDLAGVWALLQDGLGSDVRPFSYPFGSCGGRAAAHCAAAGFAAGFTTQAGWIDRANDTFALRRIDANAVSCFLQREPAWA